MPSASHFETQHVSVTPAGWRVRTVRAGAHEVRVAFPPGARRKGSGRVVEVLHPRGENPSCQARKNPMELLIMGANPMRKAARSNPLQSFTREEKLKLGRAGIKWRSIQTEQDAERARKALREFDSIRTRFNPTAAAQAPAVSNPNFGYVDGGEPAEVVAEIYKGFHAKEIDRVFVEVDPHIPSGEYAWLGVLYALHIKPPEGAPDRLVKNQMFPTAPGVISAANRRQIYFCSERTPFTDAQLMSYGYRYGAGPGVNLVELGEVREIRYIARKWHDTLRQHDPQAYGKPVNYMHKFGEENGRRPVAFYDRSTQRVLLHGGDYFVKDEGIVN